MQTALQWLYDNLYSYMIPVCALCILRIVMCLIELRHMKRLRDKKFVFRRVSAHYREIGAFIGLFIGCVLICLIPSLALLFAAVAIVLGVIGHHIGKSKGDEADRIWKAVVDELAQSEDSHKLNALSVESNFGGLLDTLDVYDDEDSAPSQPEQNGQADAPGEEPAEAE